MTVRLPAGAEQPEEPVVLSGRYELTELLDSGATAGVYLARDLELNRVVVVKLLRGGPDADHIERLRREARAVAAIDDRHVVSVHDIGVTDETVYVVMEYVRGESLRALLRRQGPLVTEEAARVAVQVCAGLSAAHSVGVVHRDVSTANIMLGDEGTVKVLDFGTARGPTSAFQTTAGEVWGTPAFLSPEQARGEQPDARSDVYSLGCCLYQMVTGYAPFEAPTPWEVVTAHLHEQPRPPRELEPMIPLTMQRIIMRALAKRPEDRYPTADAMSAALGALGGLAGTRTLTLPAAEQKAEPIEQSPAAPPTSSQNPVTELEQPVEPDTGALRRWVGLTMIAVAVAVLLVALVVATL